MAKVTFVIAGIFILVVLSLSFSYDAADADDDDDDDLDDSSKSYPESDQVTTDKSVPTIITVLADAHKENNSVVVKGACALMNVFAAKTAKKKIEFAQQGALPLIVRVLEAQQRIGAPAVLEACLSAIWELAIDEQNKIEFTNLGLLPLIMEVLQANYEANNVKVLEKTCGIITFLGSADIDNKVPLWELGAVPLLVKIVDEHHTAGNHKVVENACYAIAVLAQNKDIAVDFANIGVLPLAVKLLVAYADDAEALLGTLTALWYLAVVDDNAKQLSQLGAMPLLSQILNSHTKAHFVMEKTCYTLGLVGRKADVQEAMQARDLLKEIDYPEEAELACLLASSVLSARKPDGNDNDADDEL